jgi:hypothetical protein
MGWLKRKEKNTGPKLCGLCNGAKTHPASGREGKICPACKGSGMQD